MSNKNSNVFLSTKIVDLAEHDNYLEMTNRLCYYDDINLNGVVLPYKDNPDQAEIAAKSLINMPVQAKYKKVGGKDDLGGHEMYVDDDGDYAFDTMSIGVHTDAYIKEDTVTTVGGETKTLPCLFASCRLWTRYKNTTAAVKRLYESESGLNSSWEIATKSYSYSDGIKTLTDYEFLSNCLLGSSVTPAYSGTASALSLSEAELLVAEALSQDLGSVEDIQKSNKEENALDEEIMVVSEEEVTPVEETETSETEENIDEIAENLASEIDDVEDEEDSECKKKKACSESNDEIENETSETEVSSLTTEDIYRKLYKACSDIFGRDSWYYIAYVMPEEHYALCKVEPSSELDYMKVDYTIVDDEVEVSDPQPVSLTVSVGEINEYVSELSEQISSKDEAILKISEEVSALKTEVAELGQYKEKFEAAEQEKIAEEIRRQKEELIASVTKSGHLTREEIEESEELKGYVETLNKSALASIVGERVLASVVTKASVDVSESRIVVKHNLDADEDVEISNKVDLMRKYLHN